MYHLPQGVIQSLVDRAICSVDERLMTPCSSLFDPNQSKYPSAVATDVSLQHPDALFPSQIQKNNREVWHVLNLLQAAWVIRKYPPNKTLV